MHILLVLLKTAGFIILALLVLLIVLLMTVLFVPLRYSIVFRREAVSPSEDAVPQSGTSAHTFVTEGLLKIHWLLHLVGLDIRLQGTKWGAEVRLAHAVLKRFGPLHERAEASAKTGAAGSGGSESRPSETAEIQRAEAQQAEARKAEARRAEVRKTEVRKAEGQKTEIPEAKVLKAKVLKAEVQQAEVTEAEAMAAGTGPAEAEPKAPKTSKVADTGSANVVSRKQKVSAQKRSWRQQAAEFLRSLADRITDLMELLSGALRGISGKLEELQNRVEHLLRRVEPFLSAEAKSWYGRVWRSLTKVLHRFAPRKARGKLTVGTGSPDTTAVAVGILYKILPADSAKMDLQPDFYETALEGNITLSGHMRMWHPFWMLVTLLLDKQTRKMIRRVMRRRGGK